MTTFVPYHPRGNAPSFRGRNSCKSPTFGLPNWMLKRQNPHHPEWMKPWSNPDFVDFVDLTDPDTAREYLVAREILEPVDHETAEHRVRVARDRSSDGTEVAKVDDGSEDDSDNHESEASDLPSLRDLFAWTDRESRGSGASSLEASASEAPVDSTRKERSSKCDSENRVNPMDTTATSVEPGTSQDNPIVLDDEQLVNKHGPAIPDDEKPTFENSSTRHNADSCGDGEKTRSENLHKDEVLYSNILVAGEDGGDGHDGFVEYKRTFGMTRWNQRTSPPRPHDSPDSDLAAGSISRPINHEEPRAVADDGVTTMGQPIEEVDDEAGSSDVSGRELENWSTSQGRQESNQWPETDEIRSESLATFSGDCHLESTLTPHSPSPPRMTADEATRPEPSTLIRGARTRTRPRPSVAPEILPDNGTTRKRPRRATEGTWKARNEGDSGASGNGIGADVPASTGLIPNIFVEHEKTTSIPRRTRSAACSASHNLQNCNLPVGAIPRHTQGVRSRKRSRSSTGLATPSANGAVRKQPCRAIKETRKAREA